VDHVRYLTITTTMEEAADCTRSADGESMLVRWCLLLRSAMPKLAEPRFHFEYEPLINERFDHVGAPVQYTVGHAHFLRPLIDIFPSLTIRVGCHIPVYKDYWDQHDVDEMVAEWNNAAKRFLQEEALRQAKKFDVQVW